MKLANDHEFCCCRPTFPSRERAGEKISCKIFAKTMCLFRGRMSRLLRVSASPTFLLLTSMVVLFVSPARATMTEVFGGPGGGNFSMTCDPGNYLVGFHGRAGGSVDGIGLICAPYDARIGKTGSGSRKEYRGGRGGTEQEVYCGPGEPLTGVGLAHTRGGGLVRQYVNTVDIFCKHRPERTSCISSGEGCGPIPSKSKGVGTMGAAVYQYDRTNCPANEAATGIQGRSGNLIDAMGLICASLPAAPPPAAAGGGAPQQVEINIDRPGNDYRNFDLSTASHESCRVACIGDMKCKAYTYVKPGVQGPKARCYLKDSIPATRVSDCCVSGVRPIRKLGKRPTGPDPNIDYGGAAKPTCGPGRTGTPPNCSTLVK